MESKAKSKAQIDHELAVNGFVEGSDDFICPHCGFIIEEIQEYSSADDEWKRVVFNDIECDRCGKSFRGIMTIDVVTKSFYKDKDLH